MRRTNRGLLVTVEGALVALAVASAVLFVSWVLGYNGFGVVDGAHLPLRLSQTTVVPSEQVQVRGTAGLATADAGNAITGGLSNGAVRQGDGASEFFGNESGLSFWSLTSAQHLSWVSVRA